MCDEKKEKEQNRYICYEYLQLVVSGDSAQRLLDEYRCFGWELNEDFVRAREASIGMEKEANVAGKSRHDVYRRFDNKSRNAGYGHSRDNGVNVTVTLYLRRNRDLVNITELTRLQRNFEAFENEIEELNRHKTSRPLAEALNIGLVGTAFLACSIFAVLSEPPHVLLCILFVVPGFVGWAGAYPLYQYRLRKQEKKIAPLIIGRQQEMEEICKKGEKLLH